MKKIYFLALTFVFAANLCAQTATSPSAGDGTQGNPYQIATLNNLYWITQNTSSWSSYFKQTANIDASSSSAWASGAGFTPIGNSTTTFTGTYDGGGFTISGLHISQNSSSNNIGMFGDVGAGTIKDLGLTSENITGGIYVGGLAGSSNGTISNCYNTGSVISTQNTGSYAGGLVGMALVSSTISNCYSTASVSGSNNYVGGLVGVNNHTISDCYSTGAVSGTSNVGGLVGYSSGTVSSSFWDTGTSGQVSSAGGTGETDAAMKTQSTFTSAGWDFTSTWAMSSSVNNGYPGFYWQTGYPPLAPTLATPANSAVNEPGSLTLKVNSSTNATGYNWQVSTSSSFSTLVYNNSTSGVGDTAYTVALTSSTRYFWRVCANNTYGSSSYSTVNTFFTSAPSGQTNALLFGGGQYVVTPASAALNTSTLTVEMAIKPAPSPASTEEIARLKSSSTDDGLELQVGTDGNIHLNEYSLNNVSWNSLTSSGVNILDGNWHYIAVSSDGGYSSYLYVDGVQQGYLQYGVGFVSNVLLYLGMHPSVTDYYKGEISEVRVWNSVLTQAQIQSNMNTTLTGSEPGLIGYWPLNESGTTTDAYDETSNQNDGTLQGFTFDGTTNGWLSTSDGSLAVQATDFLAKADVGSVTLSWKTQSEVDNAGFNVLRQPSGVSSWQLVASYTNDNALKGLGTSSTGRAYQFVDTKVKSGAAYNYKIQSVAIDGTTKDVSTLTGITVDVPKAYVLYQNYPNPFNPSTTIRFDLKEQSTVTLEIYNVLGQMVESRYKGIMEVGRYNEVVDMSRFASGVYYYRIIAQGNDGQKFVEVKKLVLMK